MSSGRADVLQRQLEILHRRLRIVAHGLAGVDHGIFNFTPQHLAEHTALLVDFIEQGAAAGKPIGERTSRGRSGRSVACRTGRVAAAERPQGERNSSRRRRGRRGRNGLAANRSSNSAGCGGTGAPPVTWATGLASVRCLSMTR